MMIELKDESSKIPSLDTDRKKNQKDQQSQHFSCLNNSNHIIRHRVNNRLNIILGEKFQLKCLKIIQQKMHFIDLIILLSTIMSAILAVIASESFVTFSLPPDATLNNVNMIFLTTTTVTTLRSLVLVCTIIIETLLIIHYILLLKFYKIKELYFPEDTLFSSGLYKYLLIELFLNFFHSPPNLNFIIQVSQRDPSMPPGNFQSDFFFTNVLLFFRSYQIIKYFAFYSKWNSYMNEKICMESKSPPTILFVIKAEFKDNPFIMLGTIMLISIFVFGYSLRSVEMFFMNGQDPSKVFDWRYFWNGLWCIIITMSTVGFGDFYPISLLGRTIAVLSCFWGAFLISMMVAGLTNAVEFNSQESISYDSIKSAQYDIDYGTSATIFIQNSFRYYSLIKFAMSDPSVIKNPEFRTNKSSQFHKLKDSTFYFRQMRSSKNDKVNQINIEKSLYKIESILNVDFEKIKTRAKSIDLIEDLLTKYHKIQTEIKENTVELYKELEEMNVLKEKYKFK